MTDDRNDPSPAHFDDSWQHCWAGLQAVQVVDYHGLRERDIERLADLVEQHLDTQALEALCGLPPRSNGASEHDA